MISYNSYKELANDIIEGKRTTGIDCWYYCNQLKDCNIFDPIIAKEFIHRYFWEGAKATFMEIPFPEYDNTAITSEDSLVPLPEKRAVHSASAFILGLIIEKCLNGKQQMSICSDKGKVIIYHSSRNPIFPFNYIWYLTALYHDMGYCFAEGEKNNSLMPEDIVYPPFSQSLVIDEINALHHMMEKLNLSISPIENLLRNLLSQDCSTLLENAKNQSTDLRMKTHWYTEADLIRYYNYRIYLKQNEKEHGGTDHGIVGGCLFFDKAINNYLGSYDKYKKIEGVDAQKKCSLNHFEFENKVFRIEQIPVFLYIADCICSHNIFKASDDEEYLKLYKDFKLDNLIDKKFKRISYQDNPLLYILSVADTLEPTKIFDDETPETIASAIRIKFTPGKRKISFKVDEKNYQILEKLHNKAEGLRSWTTAEVDEEIVDNKFTVYL